MDPALRAFAVTNLEKVQDSSKWEWRINVEAIFKSMTALAQFDLNGQEASKSGKQYTGDTLFIAGGKSRYIRSTHLKAIGKSRYHDHWSAMQLKRCVSVMLACSKPLLGQALLLHETR